MPDGRHPVPDLAALRLLRDVAEQGSIGAAGRSAGISQQSASERLRAVETQTGLVLVQRTPHGSTLTPAGRLLVQWSAELLEQADRPRRLQVWASMTTAEYLLPSWLVVLRGHANQAGQPGRPGAGDDGPSVSLRATNSEAVVAAVRDGTTDLGFIESDPDRAGLTGLAHRTVGHDTLRLVVAPDDPLGRRRTAITAAGTAGMPVTGREPGSGTRQVVESAYAAVGLRAPVVTVELTTTTAVLAAVRAGSPPAFLSELAVRPEIDAGRLVAVPVRGLDLRRDLTAVWVGGPHPPAGPLRDLLAIASRSGEGRSAASLVPSAPRRGHRGPLAGRR